MSLSHFEVPVSLFCPAGEFPFLVFPCCRWSGSNRSYQKAAMCYCGARFAVPFFPFLPKLSPPRPPLLKFPLGPPPIGQILQDLAPPMHCLNPERVFFWIQTIFFEYCAWWYGPSPLPLIIWRIVLFFLRLVVLSWVSPFTQGVYQLILPLELFGLYSMIE